MYKFFLSLACLLLAVGCTKISTTTRTKTLDEGGSGPYKAVGVADSTLSGLTIYRPLDMEAATDAEGRALPLMVFANGACTDCNAQHWRMLSDIASYGYIVVAVGELQDSINDRPHNHVEPIEMIRGINWAEQKTNDSHSEYSGIIDMDNVCFAGMSCGGAMMSSSVCFWSAHDDSMAIDVAAMRNCVLWNGFIILKLDVFSCAKVAINCGTSKKRGRKQGRKTLFFSLFIILYVYIGGFMGLICKK